MNKYAVLIGLAMLVTSAYAYGVPMPVSGRVDICTPQYFYITATDTITGKSIIQYLEPDGSYTIDVANIPDISAGHIIELKVADQKQTIIASTSAPIFGINFAVTTCPSICISPEKCPICGICEVCPTASELCTKEYCDSAFPPIIPSATDWLNSFEGGLAVGVLAFLAALGGLLGLDYLRIQKRVKYLTSAGKTAYKYVTLYIWRKPT